MIAPDDKPAPDAEALVAAVRRLLDTVDWQCGSWRDVRVRDLSGCAEALAELARLVDY